MHWKKVALAMEGLSQVTRAWQWFSVQCGLIHIKEIFLRFNQFICLKISWQVLSELQALAQVLARLPRQVNFWKMGFRVSTF